MKEPSAQTTEMTWTEVDGKFVQRPWTAQDQLVRAITDTIMNRIVKGNEPLRDSIEGEIRAFTDRLMERQGWTEWPSHQ